MRTGRLAGGLLLAATYLPTFRILDPERAGPAASATLEAATVAWSGGLYGSLLVLGGALVLGILAPGDLPGRIGASVARAVEGPSSATFGMAVGAVALALSAAVAVGVHGAAPTSVDEMAQLLHAQAVAAGSLAVPTSGADAAFMIQNGIVTEQGWVSIYPPLHTLLLAAGSILGAAWLVGPLATALATGLAVPVFEATLGVGLGRVAAALLSVTPFWLLLGATHLSHSTAAAALMLVAWTGWRAREGRPGWSLAAGAAVGAATTARPWVGLACSAAILSALWLTASGRPRHLRGWATRVGATLVGGLPFAVGLFAWNRALFGGPLRLGYSAAFGPAHGLGLHRDPWGNLYGLAEAVGYTSADLVQLGAHLLESPLPAVAVVAVGLVAGGSRRGAPLLGWWAASALLANALYWHHGIHFGPRMLLESTPAWVGLFVLGAHGLADRATWRGLGGWVVVLVVAASAFLTPLYVRALRDTRTVVPTALPASDPGTRTLVFAHGSWGSRVAARLASAGMRRDSIETALRRNDLCAVDRYARLRAGAGATDADARSLDLEPRPGTPSHLEVRALSEGVPVRVAPDRPWDEACMREARADRFGVVELEPLLWRAPPLPGRAVIVLRDLGPVANARARATLPGPARVLLARPDGTTALLDYDAGMELIWRGAAGVAQGPEVPGP